MALIIRVWIIFWAGWISWPLTSVAPVSTAQEQSTAAKKELVYKMYADYKKDFPGVKDIAFRDAMALAQDQRAVFVDTRTQPEQAVSMLPGAVTREFFLENPGRFKDRTVVAYCTISYRSGKFAEEMARMGVTVYNLEGGLLAWVLEGGKVFDKHGESKRIHVYGDQWDYAPPDYEAVRFGWWDRLF